MQPDGEASNYNANECIIQLNARSPLTESQSDAKMHFSRSACVQSTLKAVSLQGARTHGQHKLRNSKKRRTAVYTA